MQKIKWPLVLLLLIVFLALAGLVVPAWLVGLTKVAKDNLPAAISEQWLGFFGNIIGAIMALTAAAIAWFAAQGQIKTSQEQTSIIALEALEKVLINLRDEKAVLFDIDDALRKFVPLHDDIEEFGQTLMNFRERLEPTGLIVNEAARNRRMRMLMALAGLNAPLRSLLLLTRNPEGKSGSGEADDKVISIIKNDTIRPLVKQVELELMNVAAEIDRMNKVVDGKFKAFMPP
jgi:hypothetical protein